MVVNLLISHQSLSQHSEIACVASQQPPSTNAAASLSNKDIADLLGWFRWRERCRQRKSV